MPHFHRGDEPEKLFTKVPNDLIRNSGVSDGAFRVICWIFSHSEGFKISFEGIQANLGYGRDKLRAILKNAEESGYLVRRKIRLDSGLYDWDYYFFRCKEIAAKFTSTPLAIDGLSGGGSSGGGSSGDGQPTPHKEYKDIEDKKKKTKKEEKTPLTPQGGNRTETTDPLDAPWWEEEEQEEETIPGSLDSLGIQSRVVCLTSQPTQEGKGSGGSFEKIEQPNNKRAIAQTAQVTIAPVPEEVLAQSKKRKGLTEEEQQWFLAAYHEARPSNFVAHEVLSDRAQGQILKLIKARGNKSMEAFVEALIYVREQKDPWWRKNRFAVENFLSNDKVFEYSAKHKDAMENDEDYRDRVNGVIQSMDLQRSAAVTQEDSVSGDDEIDELFYGRKK